MLEIDNGTWNKDKNLIQDINLKELQEVGKNSSLKWNKHINSILVQVTRGFRATEVTLIIWGCTNQRDN